MLDALMSVNQITYADQVYLASTFFSMVDPNLNCDSCIKKNSEKVRNDKKGCNQEAIKDVAEHRGITYRRCPSSIRRTDYLELISAHSLFEKGVMPMRGGIFSQPIKIIEIMQFIADLKAEHYNDLKKQAEKQASRMKARNGRK